eukprot:ANDGO_01041.mRNA.1 hypothetical protein
MQIRGERFVGPESKRRYEAALLLQSVFKRHLCQRSLRDAKEEFQRLVADIDGEDWVLSKDQGNVVPKRFPVPFHAPLVVQRQTLTEDPVPQSQQPVLVYEEDASNIVSVSPVQEEGGHADVSMAVQTEAEKASHQTQTGDDSESSLGSDFWKRRCEVLEFVQDSADHSADMQFDLDSDFLGGRNASKDIGSVESLESERTLKALLNAPVDATELSASEMKKLELEMELLIAKEALRVRQEFLRQMKAHGHR